MRQVVLDTETTGLDTSQGHRIIEIGCLELVNRRKTGRTFHRYIQPDRQVDAGAMEVHGITNEFLQDKPRFSDLVEEFLEFIRGADLVIHNAPFDVGFIDYEFSLLERDLPTVADICTVTDTLVLARSMYPGQRNSLDALCRRHDIDNSHRELHGALLDAEILAEVYLAMTGGQTALSLGGEDEQRHGAGGSAARAPRRVPADRPRLRVVAPTTAEEEAHQAWLERLDKAAGGPCVWRRLEEGA
ncbi:MAG: DNA polymerase III subunit epsilon [Ectothiorhodospiraceae bacterium]|nr:DNA polymerase III subunit epsilon [Ectothiorhodospiraceae bacterium]